MHGNSVQYSCSTAPKAKSLNKTGQSAGSILLPVLYRLWPRPSIPSPLFPLPSPLSPLLLTLSQALKSPPGRLWYLVCSTLLLYGSLGFPRIRRLHGLELRQLQGGLALLVLSVLTAFIIIICIRILS